MSVASRPATWESTLPVTQLVLIARGAFLRSTPYVRALRGFLPGRVFPDRTTRRQGVAYPPASWVLWAGRVVTFGGAAEKEGNSIFLWVVAVRQPASRVTWLFLLTPSSGGY